VYRYIWASLLKKAGFRQIHVHDLRHTFASLLIQNGESLAYVKEQMGHSSIKMTVDTCGHLVPGGNKAAVDKLDGLEEATICNPAATSDTDRHRENRLTPCNNDEKRYSATNHRRLLKSLVVGPRQPKNEPWPCSALEPSSAWLCLLVGPRKVKPTLSGSISWRGQALIRARVFNCGSAWMRRAALDRRSFSQLILHPRRALRTCVNACARLARCMRRLVSQARNRAVDKFYEEVGSFDSARVRKLPIQSTTTPPVIATSATLKTPVRSGPRPRFKKSITLPS